MKRVPFLEEDRLWLWLDSFSSLTPGRIERLLYGDGSSGMLPEPRSVRTVYEMKYGDYLRLGLDEESAHLLADQKDLSETDEQAKAWREREIDVISCENPVFPAVLLSVNPPVHLLYACGHTEWLEALTKRIEAKRTLSIIGSRRCTNYGSGAARYLSSNLAAAGFWIISGMAGGIDSHAHEGALDVSGKTIAVLGCGVDVCYPSSNRGVYKQIRKNGLLLSEYPPGADPLPWHFPLRNRIIAALGSGLVVAEAAKESGTMITVDFALEMDRPVFAVPGPLFQKNSEGTNRLIFQGAYIITDWNDISDVLGGIGIGEDRQDQKTEIEEDVAFPDPELQLVYEQLDWISQTPEELLTSLPLSPAQLMKDLTILELEGAARRSAEGGYMRKKRG